MAQNETAVSRTTAKSAGPVTVKVSDPRIAQRKAKRRFWFGVTRDAPFVIFTIGAHAFCQYGGHVTVADEGKNAGKVLGNPPRGNFADMTDSDVELITNYVKQAWVKRYRPSERGCLFFHEHSATGVPDEDGVEPLGTYMYLIPEAGMSPSGRDPRGEPPTMVPRS